MASLFAKLGAKAATMAAKHGSKVSQVAQKAQQVASKAEKIGNVLDKASSVLEAIPTIDTVSVNTAPSIDSSLVPQAVDTVKITTIEPSGSVQVVTASYVSKFWIFFAVSIVVAVLGTLAVSWMITIGKSDKEKSDKRNTLLLTSMLPMLLVIFIGFGFYHIKYR